MTELLPCPFCGGEAEILTAESMNGGYLFGIMCNDCLSRGDVYDTEAEAIAAWNSRAAMEFDNWFYLPKPKEPIVEVTETTHAWDGTKVKTDVFYQVQEQAVINWAKELDEHIIKRICEVWNTRAERTCKADEVTHRNCKYSVNRGWRERTCKWEYPQGVNGWNGYTVCSNCGAKYDETVTDEANYCPNCGAKVIGDAE